MEHNAYELGLYEKALPASLSWAQRFQAVRAGGFDYLELSIDESDARLNRLTWSHSQRRALVSIAADNSVALGSLCLSAHRKYPMGSTNDATRRRSMDILRQALDLSADLGIRMIQLAGYDVYYEESTPRTRALFLENLSRAVTLAARWGVVLGFETMETPFMDTVAKATAYVQRIDSPYLQIYPDLGNLTNAADLYGVPVTEDLNIGAGHLVAAHVKQTRPGCYRNIPFEAGHVDFPVTLRAAWSLGIRRFVTELWYTDQAPHAHCQAGLLVRSILDDLSASC